MLFLFSVWASAVLQDEKSFYPIAVKVQKGTCSHKTGKQWKNIVHRQTLIKSLFSKWMETTPSHSQRSFRWMIRDNPLTTPSPTVARAQTLSRNRHLIVCPIHHISSCEGEGFILKLRCSVFLLKSLPSIITPDRLVIHLFAPIFAFNEFLCQLVPQCNYSLCDRVFL